MKTKCLLTLCFLILHSSFVLSARSQGTDFMYHGRLNEGASSANGIYDVRFTIYDSSASDSQQGPTLTNFATAVSNGLVTATLDFGAGIFNGQNRWLEIAVRTNGSGDFTTLSPRQRVTPVPYAIAAGSLLAPLTGSLLQGTYPGILTLNNGANSFSGNGAGLTGLNAATLTGVVPDARLSGNVALLSGSQTFTGAKTFNSLVVAPSGVRVDRTNLWFTGDQNHGVGYFGAGRAFAGAAPDGPVLFGFSGGALGTEQFGTEKVALLWNSAGNVGIGTVSPDRPLVVQADGGSELMSLKDNTGANRWHLNLQNGGLNFAQSAVADGRLFLDTNGNVGLGTLAPSAALDVAGAIRTRSGGIVFPDGSVQTHAAEGSTSPTMASGYPVGTTVSVTLNGSPCTLDGPLAFAGEVSGSPASSTNYFRVGLVNNATVRLTRARPAGASDWATAFSTLAIAYSSTPDNPNNWFTLAVTVTQPGGATQSVTCSQLIFTGYALRGNGVQLFEVADLIARITPAPIVRSGSLPPTTPSADLPGLSVLTNGAAFPGVVVTALPLLAIPIIDVDENSHNSVVGLGVSEMQDLNLRANFSSGAGLLSWVQDGYATGSTRSIAVRQGGVTLVAATNAFGWLYRLQLADDGLPIEELGVMYANLTAPTPEPPTAPEKETR